MEKIRKRRNTGRVTLQDVADYAGVGSMTVSRVLRVPELVSDQLREKVIQAVEILGYIPNRSAGALASASSHSVAVLLPSLIDKTCATFMQSLQSILNKHQLQVILGCHEYNQSKEQQILMTLLQSNPAALIVFGSQLSDKTYQSIERSQIPMVNVIGSNYVSANLAIETDFLSATQQMTKHLLVKGYQNIGFIGAHMDNRLQAQQLNSWNRVMLNQYKNADQIITTPDAPSLGFGRYALNEMLLRHAELDAVICSHEEIAIGVLFECQRRLLKVPTDIAVACLQGSENCDQTYPRLTSIRVDYKKMGEETGRRLVELLTALASLDDTHPITQQRCEISYLFDLGQSS